jgi:3-oxoacyl-[acyl-carrier-protein] synthase-3
VTRPTLTQATGPAHTRILGLGAARGENVVPNDDLGGPYDSTDDGIRQRTGIATRVRAGADTDVLDLAEIAGRQAIANAGLQGTDIDAVILATVTYFHQTPSGAAVLADRLGATPAAAFDVSAACAGYCYGIAQADALVRAGSARNVLVIGAEKMTSWMDWTDRSTCIIFADGAGAAVVGPSGDGEPSGIGPVVWGSAGDMAQKITIDGRNGSLKQDGQAVFRWATTAIAPIALEACRRAGVTPADISAFIPHQANLRIIEAIAKKLGIPRDRVADDIIQAGNTSSASVPLALSRMAEQGRLQPGTPALLVAFGAGLCYASQVITVP